MVDAADSKSATCEGVGVQVPSPVYSNKAPRLKWRVRVECVSLIVRSFFCSDSSLATTTTRLAQKANF